MMYAHVDMENTMVDGADTTLSQDDPNGGEACELAFAKADLENLTYKLNNLLPSSIAIQGIFPVEADAHARFDAVSRTYIYKLSPHKNPFSENQTYYYRPFLDFDKMNTAAKILLDYNDFECFSKVQTEVRTYLCTITHAAWKKVDDEWHFTISADRFLRNMVRAIVGTLIEIGRDKQSPEWMHEVLRSKSRSMAGASAPAHGLYLQTIIYPEKIV